MPPRFEGGTSGAAPLRIQLATTASGDGSVASVIGWSVAGENTSGAASRPIISRPSSIGTGTGQTPEVRSRPSSATPNCELLTTFSGAPSVPAVSEGSFNLPIVVSWLGNREDGVIVGSQGASAALLLYASASGGHTWTGAIIWEEL